MHFAKLFAVTTVIVLLASLAGCGPVNDAPATVTPPSSTSQIKAALTDLAQSGELGSGGMTLEQEIEKLRSTDAAKADALKKDYAELKTLGDPEKTKAKAKEMLSKL